MTDFLSKASTAVALGLPNIARVASYRLGVKLGLNPVRGLQAAVPQGPFFERPALPPISAPPVSGWQTSAQLFSHWPFDLTAQPPDWLANPFTGQRLAAPERGWWQIPDFDPAVGDIKLIWELSRMDWVLAFAQRARNGDGEALARLNDWLTDWCTHNPPYRGPNWKCGQEASMRVMHLAMAAMILGQVQQPATGLRDLIRLHLQRIAPTVQYAMAQDNNHGTSEAAALFIGGSWLAALGVAEAARWQQAGRYWLENRAARLIGPDGSFSQYSLNYHRVMLDTFCMVEVWRRHMALPTFSERWCERALAATQWQHHMVNPINGEGPNLGANDGARLLQLTDSAYRDYRPSVQLAMALFADQRAYAQDGTWNHPLHWLGVSAPQAVAPPPGSRVGDDGGFAVLRRGAALAMLRYPRFRFRPSQADALHLDLWLGGENLLRDAGSYSYNTETRWLNYFGGTASHNTVQFDDRDQMPRLGRFLFGDWLKTSFIEPLMHEAQAAHFAIGYRDGQRASHQRRICLGDAHLRVVDDVAGFTRKAVQRWRLAPGDWKLAGQSLTNGAHVLTVRASMPIVRCELVEGWESRHYLEKTPVPVLEIEVRQPGTLTTEYRWTP
ncbi:heparinase II/III family protein [Rhodoferax sp.]|uniref:heparinase II/III family protein n=1 Tax=Rhodoferax sp. TaxID=50421 RepID=UPI00272FE8D9|nr:alginate lyase family protein [Rhodoferax sp.]MDP2440549.1 alginate lyase family protein [Rhodoferax sp.]MDZ4208674.1 alginate lyase family protein [Rhodoferax sp.]